jgi:hypothetical protein
MVNLKKNSVPQKLKDAGLDVSNFDGVELAKKSILYGGVISAMNWWKWGAID